MKDSLSARLTYRIMAVVLVMMAIIAGVVYFTIRRYMLAEAEERYLGFLLENHQEIRRKLSDVHVAAENNVHDIERDIDDPDKMFDHMQRIIRQNRSIVCCALLFKQDHYPSKGRVFVPCARKDAADSIIVSRIDSTYNSYFYREWFQNQLKADRSTWTDPYFESQFFAGDQEPRLLTTYVVPIHDHDGRPVALLSVDLSLEWLRNELMEDISEINNQYEKGLQHQSYFFIVNREGTYIIHPKKELMLTPCDRNIGKTMLAHRGTCVMEIDGVKSRLYYRSLKYVNWTMVIVAPLDVIMANAKVLNIIILAVMIIGLLAIYLFCRRQIKEIADPFAAQKAAVDRELTIAHDIQMGLLPQSFPEHADIDLYAAQTPARDVGGDLYDYFVHKGRLVFCIGDVSGKGVPAALLMAVMRAMFRSEARRACSAAEIVGTMNRNLSEEYAGDDFVTMFVGILDLASGHLDYCNAGHEAPLLSGQPLPVLPNLPVGALADWTYEGQQEQLQSGDMLFLSTDGLSEAKNAADEQFGRKHVLQLANDHRSLAAKPLIELMMSEVSSHTGDALQSDDITMLAVRWLGNGLTLKPSMDDIGRLAPFITSAANRAGIEGKEAKRLRLAAEETVANIINYGQATAIKLQATVADNQLELTIDDDGLPFDPTQDSPTDLSVPPDQRPPGGLGIMLLHQMTDGLDYQRIDGHNVLKIKKVKK